MLKIPNTVHKTFGAPVVASMTKDVMWQCGAEPNPLTVCGSPLPRQGVKSTTTGRKSPTDITDTR